MKRFFRATAFVVALIMVMMTFTGCNALDAMRQSHAFYTEDGNILFEGNEYVIFEYEGEIFPMISSSVQCIYVTESDVPVLLSQMLGDELQYSDDKVFLVCSEYMEDTYYCRKDVYDEYMEMISQLDYTKYCYSYTVEIEYEETDMIYVLEEDEAAAIDYVINETEAITMPDGASFDYDVSVGIEAATDDLIFRKEKCTVIRANRNYYIETVSEENGDTVFYAVPEELEDAFDGIIECYLDSRSEF